MLAWVWKHVCMVNHTIASLRGHAQCVRHMVHDNRAHTYSACHGTGAICSSRRQHRPCGVVAHVRYTTRAHHVLCQHHVAQSCNLLCVDDCNLLRSSPSIFAPASNNCQLTVGLCPAYARSAYIVTKAAQPAAHSHCWAAF